jgi:3-phenylpropionate/trans-cinnamate dioxygenase ferredoxin reductase subunit
LAPARGSGTIIAGGSLAGFTTAQSLRTAGYSAPIQIFSGEVSLPYNRPPLSKQILLGKWSSEQTLIATQELMDKLEIEFHSGQSVDSLSTENQEITAAGKKFEYENLVIATGVRARQLSHTATSKRTFTFRTLADALAIKGLIEEIKTVGVIGSGVLGCEIASAISTLGKKVTIVDQIPLPNLPMTGGHVSGKIHELFIANQVDMRMKTQIESISVGENSVRIELKDSPGFEVDILIITIGSIANTEWLQSSGLDISNGVLCDAKGEAAENIYAVGDVARWWDKSAGAALKRENQSSAIEQGLAVGHFIATGEESVISLPFFWSEIFGAKITLTGNLEPELPFQVLHGSIDEDSFVGATFRGDQMTGVIGWNMSKEFRQERKKMEERANG